MALISISSTCRTRGPAFDSIDLEPCVKAFRNPALEGHARLLVASTDSV